MQSGGTPQQLRHVMIQYTAKLSASAAIDFHSVHGFVIGVCQLFQNSNNRFANLHHLAVAGSAAGAQHAPGSLCEGDATLGANFAPTVGALIERWVVS